MKLLKISDLFDLASGNGFALNKLKKCTDGINFVSRSEKNNGVSAEVESVLGVEPTPANTITVALGGSVLSTFLQLEPFYSGYHIACLTPKLEMTLQEKLFYCACIYVNKFRYNYGRQANRTLKDILIPELSEIPRWVSTISDFNFDDQAQPFIKNRRPDLEVKKWKWFVYQDLFDIERGQGPRKKDVDGVGSTPIVTSSDSNNGWTSLSSVEPFHEGNTISVNRDGSVAESYYQPLPFCSSEAVHIFKSKFEMNKYVALFMTTLIRREKYRYNYGRKWGIARMNKSLIKLPADGKGNPDYKFMEQYIKSLPFSKGI